jgi:hypothetical protein
MNKKFLNLLMMFACIFTQQAQAIDWSQYYNTLFTKNNGIAIGVGCGVAAAGVLGSRCAYIKTYNSAKERGMYPTRIPDVWWKFWKPLTYFKSKNSMPFLQRCRNNYYITVGISAVSAVAAGSLAKVALDRLEAS